MAGQPPERNDGANLYGLGDIDMWTDSTRAVGHAVAGIGQQLGSTVPRIMKEIAITHEEISDNITERDETSKKYKEQENQGLPEFVEAVNDFPERLAGRADECLQNVEFYLASDDEMDRRMRDVSGFPAGPGSRA